MYFLCYSTRKHIVGFGGAGVFLVWFCFVWLFVCLFGDDKGSGILHIKLMSLTFNKIYNHSRMFFQSDTFHA